MRPETLVTESGPVRGVRGGGERLATRRRSLSISRWVPLIALAALVGVSSSLLARGQAPAAGGKAIRGQTVLEGEALDRFIRALDGRVVRIEVVRKCKESPGERVILSRIAVVVGQNEIMVLAPQLPQVLSLPDTRLDVITGESGGKSRRLRASCLQSDPSTGLTVLRADKLYGRALRFQPPAVADKNFPVVLVEPKKDGGLNLRRGRIVHPRVYIDQGKGKNPLLLFELEDSGEQGVWSYTRWEDDLASGAGAFLSDLQGKFLGIVSPPLLNAAAQTASCAELKKGEGLALPAEVAGYLVENLAKGRIPCRGYFGVCFREVRDVPEDARRLGIMSPAARVERVYPGGPADRAGMRAGDLVISIVEKGPVSYKDLIRFSELVEYGGQGKLFHIQAGRCIDGKYQVVTLKIRMGTR